MVEVIGDPVMPSVFVVPEGGSGAVAEQAVPNISGALFLSGSKLHFTTDAAGTTEIVSSS